MMTIAALALSPDFDLPGIAAAAGAAPGARVWYSAGTLYVQGVAQADLEAAAAAYDHAAFLAARAREDIRQQLAASDAGMARVTEDVLAALIAKGTLTDADLPPAVRDKLAARAALREQLA